MVNDLEPKERDIAMVFQNYALYPQMTVEQNMGFALEMAGIKKPEIKRKVDQAAAILGLQPLLGAQAGASYRAVSVSASPWVVRSCAIRRCSCSTNRSRISTPSCALQMRAEIKALQQRLNTTTVYVTHDQIEAMTMADKIVVMHGGRVEQIGAPLELYDRPVNQFVAGFLGSPAMNFIPGTLRADNGPRLELARWNASFRFARAAERRPTAGRSSSAFARKTFD